MPYNRERAVRYAIRWAYGFNPNFYNFSNIGGDCTNFASQCLLAGGLMMNFTPIFGWYYLGVNNRSASWTGVNELYNFLITNDGVGPRAVETDLLQIENADLIQFDFNDDGRFDHTPIVVDRGEGTPDTVLVAAHSNAALFRPLSTYPYRNLRCLHIL
ncbi:MAG: amidase domain-containing protein [Clostridia bacterium]|nr:amidase domain-containing protein [Clostridia bacterium]